MASPSRPSRACHTTRSTHSPVSFRGARSETRDSGHRACRPPVVGIAPAVASGARLCRRRPEHAILIPDPPAACGGRRADGYCAGSPATACSSPRRRATCSAGSMAIARSSPSPAGGGAERPCLASVRSNPAQARRFGLQRASREVAPPCLRTLTLHSASTTALSEVFQPQPGPSGRLGFPIRNAAQQSGPVG
jgi:hypothetical protein